MTRPSLRLAAALLAATALSACAGQQTTRTGFLADAVPTAALVADAADPATLGFAAPAARLAGYAAVIVEPVAFRPGPAAPAEPDPAVVRGLSDIYAGALAASFRERGYAAVEAPSGRTLRVRAAITGYERANVALNVLTTLVIAPVTAGGASSEAEVLDAETGERLAALATHSNGTPFLGGPHNYYLEHGHARAALQRHAAALAGRLPDRAAATVADAR
jgi:hypothetical protein